jgi:hypothetical protein
MLKRFKNWLKLGLAYRNIEHNPMALTATVAIRRCWLDCPEMVKDFAHEFVQAEAARMLKEVMRIVASEDPRMENRKALSQLVDEYARLQVLVLAPIPEEDHTQFRGQPGITGEMKKHLPLLAKNESWLKEILHGYQISTPEELWSLLLLRYRQAWAWTQVLNAVRIDLDDYNTAVRKDWFLPFVTAMAAAYEHVCRDALGLAPALDDSDGQADLHARMMATFALRVLEGHTYPDLAWENTMSDVFTSVSDQNS